MADPGRSINERVAILETSLGDHVRSCEKKADRAFKMQLVVLTALLSVVLKTFGVI